MVSISVVISNFNGAYCLPRTVENLKSYPYPFREIIVVDDGSTDGSPQWLTSRHPDVRIVSMGCNTAQLNRVRNAGLQAAGGTHAFLTDNDIELTPGCIERLLEVLQSQPAVLCVTPRLLYDDDQQLIFQDGNGIHFLGLSTGSSRGQAVRERDARTPFPTFGGGIMLLDVGKLRDIGWFDEGYAMGWGDDGEMQLRGVLYGYRCLHVPGAVCLHRAKEHGMNRAFGQMYNRYRLLLTAYRLRTLILIAPSLLILEAGLAAGAILHGFGRDYRAAVRQTWRARADILRMRYQMQRRRRVADRSVLAGRSFELPGAIKVRGPMKLALDVVTLLFELNWRLVRWAT